MPFNKSLIDVFVFDTLINYHPNLNISDIDSGLFKNFSLNDDLCIDSKQLNELREKFNSHFCIVISDEKLEDWIIIDDIIQTIHDLLIE